MRLCSFKLFWLIVLTGKLQGRSVHSSPCHNCTVLYITCFVQRMLESGNVSASFNAREHFVDRVKCEWSYLVPSNLTQPILTTDTHSFYAHFDQWNCQIDTAKVSEVIHSALYTCWILLYDQCDKTWSILFLCQLVFFRPIYSWFSTSNLAAIENQPTNQDENT